MKGGEIVDHSLEEFYQTICQCSVPEDVFGILHGSNKPLKITALKHTFRTLVKAFPVLTVTNPDETYKRNEVLRLITGFRDAAMRKIESGTYGDRKKTESVEPTSTLKTKRYLYNIYSHIAKGDFSNVYRATFTSASGREAEAAVKIINKYSDSDLITVEAETLNKLKHQSLPVLIDVFRTRERKKGLVTSLIKGFDFETIRLQYSDGVPIEHVLWILERLLSVLGYIHSKGVLHGNLEPSNIMVVPNIHNVIPLDFVFSVLDYDKGNKYKGRNEYSAPEVSKDREAHPVSDMYALGKCILFLLGGDPMRKTFPKKLDRRVKDFLKVFMYETPNKRADDAWRWLRKLIKLRTELYGKRRFVHFKM